MVKLLIPILLIIVGVIVKVSKNEANDKIKKYWLLMVVGGTLLFTFRLYQYLN